MIGRMMKVMLVFPPQWIPAMPHLALPMLTAHLRSHGVEVIQRDLNLETYDTLLSRGYLEQTLERLRADYSSRPQRAQAMPEQIQRALAQGPQLASKVE